MDIIIFGGQSNMQGESESLLSTDIVPYAFEYKFLDDDLVPLKNPVGENITTEKTRGMAYQGGNGDIWRNAHITGSSSYGNTNLVPEFCRAYTEITGNEVTAVHIARGSTVIAEWLPNTKGYDIIVEKSLAAIKKIKNDDSIGNIFFVWLQGESDAIAGNTKEYYKQKIAELNSALKKDIGIHKFGVIRVGRFTNDQRDFEIISAQDEICKENQDFLMLTDIAVELNKEQEYMNPFVEGHYSAKGLEILGYTAGTKLGENLR